MFVKETISKQKVNGPRKGSLLEKYMVSANSISSKPPEELDL